jgi:hypothetical protein
MAAALNVPPPPPGFTLDQSGGVPPPPPGFTLDTEAPQQEAPLDPAKPNLWQRYLNSTLGAIGPVGAIEAGANLATGAIAAPVSGLAGLGAAATNAVGLTNTPAADVVEKVGGALTYEPKTAAGQKTAGVVTYPFRKLSEAGDRLGDMVNNPGVAIPTPYGLMRGGPELATTLSTSVQAAPALLMRGPKPAQRAAVAPKPVPKPQVSPRQALTDELIAKHLKISPSQTPAKVGNFVEGLAGRAKSERGISLKNAPRVNELVGEDVGLKGSKAITEGDLTRLKAEANKPYNAISQTGVRKTSDAYRQEIRSIGDRTGGASFAGDVPPDIVKLKKYYESRPQFDAKDAVGKIRQLRAEASKNIKALNAPEQNAKGHVQRAIAEALDNELARHAESLGKPELAANYKAARVQLARLHTLEDALEGSNVSAKALSQALDRGAPLSGNMKLVARAYKEFDRSFQDVGKIRDSNAFGPLDLGAGVVGAATNPALVTAVLARPIARAVLASKPYQRRLASRPSSATTTTGFGAPEANALARKPAVTTPQADARRKKG